MTHKGGLRENCAPARFPENLKLLSNVVSVISINITICKIKFRGRPLAQCLRHGLGGLHSPSECLGWSPGCRLRRTLGGSADAQYLGPCPWTEFQALVLVGTWGWETNAGTSNLGLLFTPQPELHALYHTHTPVWSATCL